MRAQKKSESVSKNYLMLLFVVVCRCLFLFVVVCSCLLLFVFVVVCSCLLCLCDDLIDFLCICQTYGQVPAFEEGPEAWC